LSGWQGKLNFCEKSTETCSVAGFSSSLELVRENRVRKLANASISSSKRCSQNECYRLKLALGKVQILKAIVLAKSKIKCIERTEHNQAIGYSFVSIDNFLEVVSPICVQAGLVILMDEVGVEDISRATAGRGDDWLRISYEITLAHISGEALGPFRRNVDVLRSGPQAYDSAQSYVLKQFLRAQFQIPTGETDDPDFGPQKAKGPPLPSGSQATETRSTLPSPNSDDQAEIARLVPMILQASCGRDLLAILAGLRGASRNHAALVAARISALRRIVASAQSAAALEKLRAHFLDDWSQIVDVEEVRRSELQGSSVECENISMSYCALKERDASEQASSNAQVNQDKRSSFDPGTDLKRK
jgi:ERF superfamily